MKKKAKKIIKINSQLFKVFTQKWNNLIYFNWTEFNFTLKHFQHLSNSFNDFNIIALHGFEFIQFFVAVALILLKKFFFQIFGQFFLFFNFFFVFCDSISQFVEFDTFSLLLILLSPQLFNLILKTFYLNFLDDVGIRVIQLFLLKFFF